MQSSLILKKDRHVHYSPNTTLTRQLGKPKVVHSWKMEVGKAKAAHASKKTSEVSSLSISMYHAYESADTPNI